VQAQRLFGDPDYLLRVITRVLPVFQQIYDDRLATLPGVQRLSSTLVMKSVVTGPYRCERARPARARQALSEADGQQFDQTVHRQPRWLGNGQDSRRTL
jgi:hypothetical protein